MGEQEKLMEKYMNDMTTYICQMSKSFDEKRSFNTLKSLIISFNQFHVKVKLG